MDGSLLLNDSTLGVCRVGFGVLLDHVETLDDSPLVLHIDLKHAARFLLALAFTGNHIDGVPFLDM